MINFKQIIANQISKITNIEEKELYTIEGTGKHVAIMDFGIKENIEMTK